jgi:hypothetical protein
MKKLMVAAVKGRGGIIMTLALADYIWQLSVSSVRILSSIATLNAKLGVGRFANICIRASCYRDYNSNGRIHRFCAKDLI